MEDNEKVIDAVAEDTAPAADTTGDTKAPQKTAEPKAAAKKAEAVVETAEAAATAVKEEKSEAAKPTEKKATVSETASAPRPARRPDAPAGDRPARTDGDRSDRPYRSNSYNGGPRQRRRKVCQFCVDRQEFIDYKDTARLRKFISERAKILPRRVTGTCAYHQRELTAAIKRARQIAILPYVND